MKKIIIWLLVIGLLAAGGVWYYIFHYAAKHRDPLDSDNKVTVTAPELYKLYASNEDSANKLYLGKILSVTGSVKSLETGDSRYRVYLVSNDSNGLISCEMDSTENDKVKTLAPGSQVNIVGQCNGYLSDVELFRCKLAK